MKRSKPTLQQFTPRPGNNPESDTKMWLSLPATTRKQSGERGKFPKPTNQPKKNMPKKIKASKTFLPFGVVANPSSLGSTPYNHLGKCAPREEKSLYLPKAGEGTVTLKEDYTLVTLCEGQRLSYDLKAGQRVSVLHKGNPENHSIWLVE